eukprot:359366-Chlamydomonas_euryale.AAC.3
MVVRYMRRWCGTPTACATGCRCESLGGGREKAVDTNVGLLDGAAVSMRNELRNAARHQKQLRREELNASVRGKQGKDAAGQQVHIHTLQGTSCATTCRARSLPHLLIPPCMYRPACAALAGTARWRVPPPHTTCCTPHLCVLQQREDQLPRHLLPRAGAEARPVGADRQQQRAHGAVAHLGARVPPRGAQRMESRTQERHALGRGHVAPPCGRDRATAAAGAAAATAAAAAAAARRVSHGQADRCGHGLRDHRKHTRCLRLRCRLFNKRTCAGRQPLTGAAAAAAAAAPNGSRSCWVGAIAAAVVAAVRRRVGAL